MRRVIDWPWREDRENKLPIKQFFFNFLHMINRGFKKEEKILVVVVVVLLVLINIFFFPFFFSDPQEVPKAPGPTNALAE